MSSQMDLWRAGRGLGFEGLEFRAIIVGVHVFADGPVACWKGLGLEELRLGLGLSVWVSIMSSQMGLLACVEGLGLSAFEGLRVRGFRVGNG